MAYVINPDGTIKVVDVEYDSAGNIRLKKTYGEEESYVEKKTQAPTYKGKPIIVGTHSKKKHKDSQLKHDVMRKTEVKQKESREDADSSFTSPKDIDLFFWSLIQKNKAIDVATRYRLAASLSFDLKNYFNERCDFFEVYLSASNAAKELCKLSFEEKVKKYVPQKIASDKISFKTDTKKESHSQISTPLFYSTEYIDLFFWERVRKNQFIDYQLRKNILATLKEELRVYFERRLEYFDWYWEASKDTRILYRSLFERKAQKAREKLWRNGAPIRQREMQKKKNNHSSGRTIGNIAKVHSSSGKCTPENGYIYGRSVNGASRQPKYGYARDRYGRIQERDHYNEDRHNEFKKAQNNQRNYDYSDYDVNDDHDGAYNGWE